MSNKKDTKKDVTAKKAVTQKVSIDITIDTKKVLTYNKFKSLKKDLNLSKQSIACIYAILYAGNKNTDITKITCTLSKNNKPDNFLMLLKSFYQLTGNNSIKNTGKITKDAGKLHAGYITQIYNYYRTNNGKTWHIKTMQKMLLLDINTLKKQIDICLSYTKDVINLKLFDSDKAIKNICIDNINTDDFKDTLKPFIDKIAKAI